MYDEIKTQFVKDRLRETRWYRRRYIDDLMRLERLIAKSPRTGWAGAIVYQGLGERYPVEKACIWAEIKEGNYVPPEGFQQRLAQQRWKDFFTMRREQIAKRKERKERRVKLFQEKVSWERAKKGLEEF